MALTDLPLLLRDEPALLQVLGRQAAVLAVPEPARPITIAGLATVGSRRPILVATPTTADAERLAHDLATFLGPDDVELFPAWETLPFERVSPGTETMGRRMRTIWRLGQAGRRPAVVVAPVRALVQRLGPHVDHTEPLVVRTGEQRDQAALTEWLGMAGYRRESQVEHRGEFAVRGSIVDVFGATADGPIRIDLWGDEVDRLTAFSVSDQRSTDDLDQVEVFPARELLPTDEVRARAEGLMASEPWGREQWERLSEGQIFDGMESWLPWLTDDQRTIVDLLPDEGLVLVVEPRRLRDRAEDILAEEADLAASLARTWEVGPDRTFPRLHSEFGELFAATSVPVWTVTVTPDGPDVATVAATGWNPVVGDGEGLVRQLRDLLDQGYRVVVAAEGEGSALRLGDVLRDQGLELPVEVGSLDRGCVLTGAKLAILAESDFTGRRRAHRAPRPRKRDTAGFFDGLTVGDYVVHHQHGVGRFQGMVKRAIGGVERDYLLLDYRGADKLYVPSDQIDAVRHYSGGDSPSLSKLGGGDWNKSKARVKAEVDAVAQELVVLYQTRLHSEGHAFPQDTPWQRELEESFPFRETPDQLKAIEEVKADMEAETPMDRLVCGDVGFGKTEVALRAAFKAVQDGKQVAVLVPTTLLATQHFQTFSDRFAPFPVRVEVMSRFLTPSQSRQVAADVTSGDVDVVIGTHRLLSQDIQFKDLGLLIVDEEQRFGVSHKEQIKQFTTNVDVLTLSATPIPRTLELSLTGIRDLTLLNTPPAERQPILTYVGEYDDRAVAESIRRELLREGQVFFVHNRVKDIELTAAKLRELVPEARVAVAHGQMDEGTLEKVVLDFWEGQFDVLVCTTIIESGIDMPTVNTLVVDRADRLGLGQLHQLRGRVGRSGQRAYAYLFHPQDMRLSEEAYERLKTIGEATELGSGFRIAMRDLEIRGAGSLLGTGQSGHIAAVGYDLYVQMVHEAVQELKGEPVRPPAEVKLDLPLDANLSADYVPKEELRLEAYRRLAEVRTDQEVDDIRAEWEDRFGPVPEAAARLLDVARLRVEAHRIGAREINVTKGPAFGGPAWTCRVSPLHLKTSQTIRLERLFKGAVYKEEQGQVIFPIPKTPDLAGTIVDLLRQLVPPTTEA
ncbi:transcription-repair coupling factor [Aquihabitans sp. G128]|uniref:transcription-repair coupling factor n=1 Tax=Aquihabitans sp. G128 TaxID=2849779 RepID=UPI001C230DDE|nr:transcription-repair coupling factor [Aquihabitans sp. G128]QXC61013.1 transcription-repair coupling factor [Aquihabitans sp. G128]